MKTLHAMILLSALSLLTVGDTRAVPQLERGKSDASLSCEELVKSGASPELLAQKACCQANKGVCGCRAGKIVCCDKTFSKDCTC